MNFITSIYKTLSCAALAAGLFTSCVNDWLDVTPSDAIDGDNPITSSADLEPARTGMYHSLKGTSGLVDYYGQQMFIYGDAHAGDDMQANVEAGSGRANFFYLMTYTAGSDFTSLNTPWQSPYIAISRANKIIAAIDGGKLSDKDDKNAQATIAQYKAEAEVIRALAHFDLVRIYGKPYTEDQGASLGVPVVTKVLDTEEKPARNTVKEVYDQVLKDLKAAIDSKALPNESKTTGYVNQWGAEGILTRVYLTMGDYQNALSTAEDVIDNCGQAGFALWNPITEVQDDKGNVDEAASLKKSKVAFNNVWSAETPDESEFLFRLNSTNNNDANDLTGIGNVMSADGYGDEILTEAFLNKLHADPKDVRDTLCYTTADQINADASYKDNRVFLNKFRGLNGNTRIVPVIPIIRLSEVYLTAAEAAFRLNDKDKAAKYLNALIERRTLDDNLKVTKDNITLDRILLERRKELVGEGQRYFDAMRTGETITRYTNSKDKGWHSDTMADDVHAFNRDLFKAISAIPQDEINANGNIKQNPGYAE